MNKKTADNRRYSFGFSVMGSLLIILLCLFIYYSTGSSFPWFIYPVFAVPWWPLGVLFAGKHDAGTFSVISSLVVIAFAAISNYTVSPSFIWFYYPAFVVIWWPLSVYLAKQNTMKIYSAFGALLLLAFFTIENLKDSPRCLWMLFTVYPVLMWPVSVILDRRFTKAKTAVALSLAGIFYYIILNMFVFRSFPWAVFTTYALLWWPLSTAFAKRRHALLFAICGALISAVLFIATNIITSPQTIWAVYPIFALVWWPLAVYYFVYKPHKI